MSNEAHTRAVPAPQQEWLNRAELRNALNLGDKAIDALIRAGKFPRGTPWDGKEHRWPWYVVPWFRFQKALEPLMQPGEVEGEEESSEPEPTKPPKK